MNTPFDRAFLAAVDYASHVPLAGGEPTMTQAEWEAEQERLKAERERAFHRSQPSYQDAEF